MWEKLLELFLKKYLDGRTPKRKAAKAFVALYTSMWNCQNAYLQFIESEYAFSSQEGRVRYYSWRSAVEVLALNVFQLRNVLHIYDPEVFRHLLSYVVTERDALREYVGRESDPDLQLNYALVDQLKAFTEFSLKEDSIYRYIITEKEQPEIIEERVPEEDFKKAIDKLREFIKKSFLLEDVLDT